MSTSVTTPAKTPRGKAKRSSTIVEEAIVTPAVKKQKKDKALVVEEDMDIDVESDSVAEASGPLQERVIFCRGVYLIC